MENKKICLELEQALKIAEGWGDGQPIAIEKDILLEKLREVYQMLKYEQEIEPEAVAEEPIVEPEPLVSPEPIIQSEPITISESEISEEPKQEPEEEQQPIEEEKPEMLDLAESLQFPSRDSEEIVNVTENALFSEEELPAKRRLDKKVLLSLYGDETEEQHVPGVAAAQYEEPVVTTPARQEQISSPTTQVEHDAFVNVNNAGHVLGEVMGTDTETFSDAYAKNNDMSDVASIISSGKVSDLHSSIGINDKFLVVRDVFDGDTEAYESAITDLERFADLDEALLHIHDKYDWNPNTDGVKFLIDLLTRKLS